MTGEVFAKGPTVIEPNNVGGTDKDRSLDRVTPPRDETLNELEASGLTDDFSKSSKPANAPAVSAATMVGVPAAVILPPTEDPNATFVAPPTEDPNATFVAPPTEDPNASFVVSPAEDPNATFVVPSGDPNATVQDRKGSDGASGDKSGVVVTDLIKGYYILGELGRGGMGVVYRARQIALNRVVAIKMILAGGHAGSEQLARFQAEAEAVAMLAHPNIVQVYDIGEQDGLPYFSLEFVDGTGLDRELGGKPQPEKKSAQLIETLARAMQFAHEHGIIHRDLKPANVLVTKNGVPKISDFGLAKQLDTDSSQTRTGTIMGTPSYMAPEQGRGEKVGPLADVYSLGSMLYEMITGRPPFVAATAVQTLMRLLKEEPVLPSRVKPNVSRDLETICLKCLQKDPHRRYASAGALAEDLHRFVAGEPILARPVSAPERLWRWCKRNPKIASLTAAVLMLLMTVATVSTVMAFRIQQEKLLVVGERNRANELATKESAARTRADRNASEAIAARELANQKAKDEEAAKLLAQEARTAADESAKIAIEQRKLALDTLYNLVTKVEEQLRDRDQADLPKLRRDIVEEAMKGLRNVSRTAENSNLTDRSMGLAFQRMADICQQAAETEEALQHHQRALAVFEKLLEADPKDDRAAWNIAISYDKLGDLTRQLGTDVAVARQYYDKALERRETLLGNVNVPELAPADRQRAVAVSLAKLGSFTLLMGDPGGARMYYLKTLAQSEAMVAKSPKDPQANQALAGSYTIMGNVSFRMREVDEARDYYGKAKKLRHELFDQDRLNLRYRRELAACYGALGDIELHLRNASTALEQYDIANKLYEEWYQSNPEDPDAQSSIATSYYRLGAANIFLGKDTAKQIFEQSLRLREQFVAADPKNTSKQIALMLAQARCGRHVDASLIANQIRESSSTDRGNLFYVGCCYALCVADVAQGNAADQLTAADLALQEQYANLAVETIRQAISLGYNDVVALEMDPDLEPILRLPAYVELIAKLKEPPSPNP